MYIKEVIYEVECILACQLKSYIDNGVGNADVIQVKETADAIKDLAETKYYCTVTEAMEKGEEYPYDKYGYSQPHYPGGTEGRITSNNMGYNGWDTDTGRHDYRVYKPMIDQEPYVKEYLDWRDAKRHYNESHTAKDKEVLDEKMRKHFNNFIATAKEMYNDSDITSKQEIKTDLLAMVNSL